MYQVKKVFPAFCAVLVFKEISDTMSFSPSVSSYQRNYLQTMRGILVSTGRNQYRMKRTSMKEKIAIAWNQTDTRNINENEWRNMKGDEQQYNMDFRGFEREEPAGFIFCEESARKQIEELEILRDPARITVVRGTEQGDLQNPLPASSRLSTIATHRTTEQPPTTKISSSPLNLIDSNVHKESLDSLITPVSPIEDSLASTTSRESNHDRDVLVARVLVLLAAAFYGTNFAVVKILDETIPVGTATTLRFSFAALAGLPWLLPSRQPQQPKDGYVGEEVICGGGMKEDDWGPTIAGMEVGMWNAVGYIAQAVGLQSICASKSAFICSLAVVFVPILDSMTGKKISWKQMFGICMAVIGIGMLELGDVVSSWMASSDGVVDVQNFLSDGPLGAGDLISLVQPVAFGVGFWRMEHALDKYPNDASRLTAGQLLSVALGSALYCCGCAWLPTGGGEAWEICAWWFDGGSNGLPSFAELATWLSDWTLLRALLWTGLVTTAMTIYMETLALRTISAAETTLIFSTEPLWGCATAAVLMGERLGFDAAIGAALILGGCLVSSSDSNSLSSTPTSVTASTLSASVASQPNKLT